MKDQLSRCALQVSSGERQRTIHRCNRDPITIRSRHRDDLARCDERETVETIGVVDASDAHDCGDVALPNGCRHQCDGHVTGLAGLARGEHLRRLLLTADTKQLDATREEDDQPTSHGEQQQRLGAHGLVRLKAVSVQQVRRLLLCAVGVAALAACGNPGVQPADPLAERSAPAAKSAAASDVAQPLAFSAPRVGGGTLDMAAYAGKPVLLWFWAPT